MRKIHIIFWIFVALSMPQLFSQNAPISTVAVRTTAGTKDTVNITAVNFTNIGSCNLRLLYNHTIVHIDSVLKGPLLGGSLNTNTAKTDTILLGWFTFPGKTLPANTVIFRIACSKVTAGTSPITWSDDGGSCIWYSGGFIPLNDIPASTYYINGSITFGGALVADFTANTTTPPKNTTVQFTDLTTGGPTSWAWSFSRPTYVNFVNGTTSASQNPQVQFTDGGLYTVTLVATNGSGSNTKVKTDYIRAGIAGQWAGVTSTEWATTTNWDNWLVPVSSTDVVIPSTGPSFWPVYTGDFTLGTECKSITMNGASLATVTGNFAINAGASLNVTNNGTFKVGGNWTNAGSFSAGTGTVEFISTSPASIISGASPPVMNTFFNLTVSKPGVSLTILPDIIVNGNLLINP
jgi:PKD repeat protein